MVSTETKMTVARSVVVLGTLAAGLFAAANLRLPLFQLTMELIHSNVTQSLFTADIYTPIGEKHISAHEFTEKCESLQKAFQIAQGSVIAAVVLLSLAVICGVLHLSPSFTKTNQRVRKVCGAPICVLLLLAVVCMGVSGYMIKGMYEKDTWCNPEHKTQQQEEVMTLPGAVDRTLRQPSVILHMPAPYATGAATAVRVADAAPLTLTLQQRRVAVLHAEPATEEKSCNYFDGCFASYQSMGFEQAVGYKVLWVTMSVAAFAMVVEMMVMAVGASVVPQAGIAAETAALLHQQDDADRAI